MTLLTLPARAQFIFRRDLLALVYTLRTLQWPLYPGGFKLLIKAVLALLLSGCSIICIHLYYHELLT